MAMRLATEYVKTYMQLSEVEFSEFINLFASQQASMQVKVFENGSQEVVLQDDAEQDIVLSFKRKANVYVLEGSCRITNPKLVNLMRKAVSLYKGSAIVHRIYPTYTMIYNYDRGAVASIVEMSDAGSKIIYEYKDTVGKLTSLYQNDAIEREIGSIQQQINGLLDLRNDLKEPGIREQIDVRLQQLTHRLFVLEA